MGSGEAARIEQATEEGLRRQEERNREQQRMQPSPPDQLRAPPSASENTALPEEAPCFVLNELRLEGEGAQQFSFLMKAVLPYMRRCVGVQGLSLIAGRLDQTLQDLGYTTTRVSLPPQNLSSGQLLIRLYVGRVQQVRMVNADQAQQPADERWGGWRHAFPIAAGDILNLRDLEQGVENMSRLPSQSVTTRLEPGSEPDTSVVYIERKAGDWRQRIRGGLTLDNSGGSALGRAQLAANLALDNPTGLNDLLALGINSNLQQPSPSHRSQSLNLNYSIPWDYNLFSLNVSGSRFAQSVQGTTVRLLSSGRSENLEARWQRTTWRTASSKTGVSAAVLLRRAWSYLDDTEVVVQRRRTTYLDLGLSHRQVFERASVDLDLSYRAGVPWQGAQPDFDSASLNGLTLRPRIWTLNANYLHDLRLDTSSYKFSSNLRAQYTRNTTLSNDHIAIGGRYSVRGFDGSSSLLAENGLIWRNELSTALTRVEQVDASVFAALDHGRVWGPSDSLLLGHKLTGMALGLRLRKASLLGELTWARPQARPSGFATAGATLYASLTYSF